MQTRHARLNPLLSLLCAGLMVAACGTKPSKVAPAVDAGPVPDAGPAKDAGPDAGTHLTNQPIGGGCAADSDCMGGGRCDTQPTGGYCILGCSTNPDCPTGSVCELTGGNAGYCTALCTTNSDCRPGYTCLAGADICVPTAGCKANTDCPAGKQCDTTTGFCAGALSGNSAIGAPCTNDSQCSVGPYPFCLSESQDDFPGGYCSSGCMMDSDCGTPGTDICVPGITNFPLCMLACTSASDCRANYNCLAFNGQSFCFAFCETNQDCIDTTQTCNPTTGLCSPGPDAGPMDAGPTDAGPSEGDAGTTTPGIDAGTSSWDGGSYPAEFPFPPQVINAGGPVMTSPKLVPIFFANDDATQVAAILDFDQQLGATSYWHAATSEYGVGPVVAQTPIMLTDVATGTISDQEIETWLQEKITQGLFPKNDPNTLYMLHYPAAMTISLGGAVSCQSFGGYHSDFTLPDMSEVIYGVVPRCSGGDFQGESPVQAETAAESHETAEASTDPEPQDNPAYVQVDDAHLEWDAALGGSEVGDLCAQDPTSFVEFPGFPYEVQRIWSNASVQAGRDPCQPEVAGEVFFNAAPESNDIEMYSEGGGGPAASVAGTLVAPGQTRTVTIDLFSEASTDDTASPQGLWDVAVMDENSYFGGQPSIFTYTLSPTSGRNGDKLLLTITSPSDTPAGTQDTYFVISTNRDNPMISHSWIGMAGQ